MSNSLFSEIDEAKKVAARLVKRNAAVESAIRKRDNALYKFLEHLHQLDKRLREMGKDDALEALSAKYGDESPTSDDPGMILLKLTYPSLNTKKCSKYAAVLRYVQMNKEDGRTVKDFVRKNGGINGCVRKEKKSWDAREGKTGKGLKTHKLAKRKNRFG
jgi:hypothetical protein